MEETDDPKVDFHGGFGDDPAQLDGEEVIEDDPEVKMMYGDEKAEDIETKHVRHGAVRNNANDEEAIVQCNTSAGPITMKFYRSWSPNGYDRATELFERGYFDHSHFFRVVGASKRLISNIYQLHIDLTPVLLDFFHNRALPCAIRYRLHN